MKKVYLDNAATTYTSSEVLAEMLPCFNAAYGNSNSTHSFGREAEEIVDRARDRIAKAIGAAKSNEIYFTSGGTEANNWAIFGLARANKAKGKHIIISAIEHDSVLQPAKQLEKEGFQVTILPADRQGVVSLARLLHEIRKDTILISIMSVNNEVGTIQNIKAIGKTARENGIIFHTDATCALGALKLDVEDMAIDALTISAHKIYGPKGIGALYVRNSVKIENLLFGGEHERGKRAGTLNTPAIAGFGKAVENATKDMGATVQKLKVIRNYLITKLTKAVEDVQVNGHPQQSFPSIISLTFERVDGESLTALLDLEGVSVSTGSACASHAIQKSHVLKAIGLSDQESQSTIRVSFAKSITKEEINFAVEKIAECVARLRKVSPLTKAGRR
ncbi:MAG: cysteine desulfurase family protein [Christensenellales bacterium]|jgi:cysteine desulfurase